MIYTRFGSPVKILSTNNGNLVVEREDGSKLFIHVSELKADGGIQEIEHALDQTVAKA